MTHTPVVSSQLSSLAHDPASGKLEVRFKNGSLYSYDNVPRSVFTSILNHPSPGGAFHQLVKGNYQHRKIQ